MTRHRINCLGCRVTFLDLDTFGAHPCVTSRRRDLELAARAAFAAGDPSAWDLVAESRRLTHPCFAAPVDPPRLVEQRAGGLDSPSPALGIVSTDVEGGTAS